MRQPFLIFSFLALFLIPLFISAKTFSAQKPTTQETINAIIAASSKTGARPALLYGLFGQETAYGDYLGKTENQWNNFCGIRNTEDCFNWRTYDCKADYRNAKHFDEILKMFGFTDAGGNADRSQIPISSTCAMGFTQFEPNTWWETSRGKEQRAYNPWDINDSVLMAAYYLQDLRADKTEILGSGEIIGSRDRIALQRYYCGANYNRSECRIYANGVEAKARRAPVALLQAGLGEQLKILEEERREIKRDLERKFIKTSAQYVPPISCDGKTYTIPVQEGEQMALLEFKKANRGKAEDLRREELISLIQEGRTNFVGGRSVSPDYIATYYGGTIVGTAYTSIYDPDLVRWFVFIHLADVETIKARLGEGFKIIPNWENRGPGSAIVEFRCGEDLKFQEVPPVSTLRTYPLLIETAGLPNAKAGMPYSFKLTVTKESSPNVSWRIISGSLPPNLSLTPSGLISGTVPEGHRGGGYDFTAEVSDTQGLKDIQPMFIIVEAEQPKEPLAIVTTELPDAIVGRPYKAALEAKGGFPPYEWTILNLQLSLGLGSTKKIDSLDLDIDISSGAISGVPTRRNTQATDSQPSYIFHVKDSRGNRINGLVRFKISLVSLPVGVAITNNLHPEYEPTLIKRKNGDLLALFFVAPLSTEELKPGLYSSVSRDDGKTWSAPVFTAQNISRIKLTEDSSGQLVLLGLGADFYDDRLSTFVSADGQTWINKRKVTPTKTNSEAYNITQAQDGYYYAHFSSGEVVNGKVDSGVYVTRSRDLISWEEPKLIVEDKLLKSEPSYFQSQNGDTYLAYLSPNLAYPPQNPTDDTTRWYLNVNVIQKNGASATAILIPALPPPTFSPGPKMFEIGGKIFILYPQAGENTLKYIAFESGSLSKFSEPIEMLPLWTSPTNFVSDFDLALLADGSFGMLYTRIKDQRVDVFFARLEKLSL